MRFRNMIEAFGQDSRL